MTRITARIENIKRGAKTKSGKYLRSGVSRILRNGLKSLINNELNSTIEHWRGRYEGRYTNAIPKFVLRRNNTPDTLEYNVEITGTEIAINKWKFLDEGTSERWAIMDYHFEPKTTRGSFKTTMGNGNPFPLIRGRAAMSSRGIEPRFIESRDWTFMAEEIAEDIMVKAYEYIYNETG